MKQRNPTSKIYKTALYLHHVKGQVEFTCSQLYDAQWDARKYYHSRLSPDWLAARFNIMSKYGYPGPDYDCTLTEYLERYPFTYRIHGYPTADVIDLDAMNLELYELLRHCVIMDAPTYSENIFSGNVTIQCQRGYLDRNVKCSPIIYSLPEIYVKHWLFAACNGFTLED